MQVRHLKDLKVDGKRIFLRLDLNVPLKNGNITDETRIREALPTINYLLERGTKVCISSHLGRPKGGPDRKYSLEPVAARLAEMLGREAVFVTDYISEELEPVLHNMTKNQFMVLENLRFHAGEEANDQDFARRLARGFDLYVNDAFGTMHRAHASVEAVAECFPPECRAAGLLVEKELAALGGILKGPAAPFTVVMGGAKVSDKMGVILSLLTKANHLLIGGAMAYTFLKFRGVAIGSSKSEDDKMDLIESIYKTAEARRVSIELPEDHVAAREFVETSPAIATDVLSPGLLGLDIGPKTARRYSRIIEQSKTVFWNGPMGVFEWPPFASGTLAIAKAMANCPGETIVGGGDSVAAVNQAGVAASMTHISTGGGASLEFIEGRVLPGVRVLHA